MPLTDEDRQKLGQRVARDSRNGFGPPQSSSSRSNSPTQNVSFSKYNLVSELGSGSFGTVYKASLIIGGDGNLKIEKTEKSVKNVVKNENSGKRSRKNSEDEIKNDHALDRKYNESQSMDSGNSRPLRSTRKRKMSESASEENVSAPKTRKSDKLKPVIQDKNKKPEKVQKIESPTRPSPQGDQTTENPEKTSHFRAIKKVPCNAPESVELALHEFWALSALTKHENVVNFDECYLQTDEKTVPMKSIRDIRPNKHPSKVCKAYLQLLEASLKGECMSYCTKTFENGKNSMNGRFGQNGGIGGNGKPEHSSSPKKLRSASQGHSSEPKISTWATDVPRLQENLSSVLTINPARTSKFYENNPACFSNSYHLWFVMEFCNGGDLNTYLINVERQKTDAERSDSNAKFVVDLANGVSFLHKNGVVHRDLKPENVLVSIEQILVLKIADFGLSKLCGLGKDGIANTILESACGSDFFMGPEVYKGNYTSKADVFALGCMCYSICTDLTFHEGTEITVNGVNGGNEVNFVSFNEDVDSREAFFSDMSEAERKELYGICIRTEFVKKEGVLNRGEFGVEFDGPVINADQKIHSSPARANLVEKRKESSRNRKDERTEKGSDIHNNSGASDDFYTPPISPKNSERSDSSGTFNLKQKNSKDTREFMPLGEAQLLDSSFDMKRIPDGIPRVKGNWSKLKEFLFSMMSRNANERPTAEEVATTIYSFLDIRMPRRTRFIKPESKKS
jgi:serine/threonine protein kinase